MKQVHCISYLPIINEKYILHNYYDNLPITCEPVHCILYLSITCEPVHCILYLPITCEPVHCMLYLPITCEPVHALHMISNK